MKFVNSPALWEAARPNEQIRSLDPPWFCNTHRCAPPPSWNTTKTEDGQQPVKTLNPKRCERQPFWKLSVVLWFFHRTAVLKPRLGEFQTHLNTHTCRTHMQKSGLYHSASDSLTCNRKWVVRYSHKPRSFRVYGGNSNTLCYMSIWGWNTMIKPL